MRRNGMLLGNVTNLIIAVLAILAFGFFVYKAFMLYSNQEQANAQKTMEFLEGKIGALHVKENNTFIVQGFEGGENWYAAGWGLNEGEAQGKPEKCFSKSCICVCKGMGACQSEGFCKFFEEENIDVYTAFEPVNVIIDPNGISEEGTSRQRGIQIGKNVQGAYIEKRENMIIVRATKEGETTQLNRPYTGA